MKSGKNLVVLNWSILKLWGFPKFTHIMLLLDLPFETYTDENGIKTIIEYKTNDDGKKVKVCCFSLEIYLS